MTMRQRDIELIIDLIEGRADDPAATHDLISRSAKARALYDEQLRVRQVLASVDPVSMTSSEQAELHRELWTELTRPSPVRAKVPWGLRVGQVAAVLALVVGGVALFGSRNGGDAASGEAETLRAADAGDTTVTLATGGALDPSAYGGIEDYLGDAPPEAATIFRRYATLVRIGSLDELTDDPGVATWCQPALPGHQYLGTIELAGRELGVWVSANEPVTGETPVWFADADTCEVVAIE
jgi:hypothetical protein